MSDINSSKQAPSIDVRHIVPVSRAASASLNATAQSRQAPAPSPSQYSRTVSKTDYSSVVSANSNRSQPTDTPVPVHHQPKGRVLLPLISSRQSYGPGISQSAFAYHASCTCYLIDECHLAGLKHGQRFPVKLQMLKDGSRRYDVELGRDNSIVFAGVIRLDDPDDFEWLPSDNQDHWFNDQCLVTIRLDMEDVAWYDLSARPDLLEVLRSSLQSHKFTPADGSLVEREASNGIIYRRTATNVTGVNSQAVDRQTGHSILNQAGPATQMSPNSVISLAERGSTTSLPGHVPSAARPRTPVSFAPQHSASKHRGKTSYKAPGVASAGPQRETVLDFCFSKEELAAKGILSENASSRVVKYPVDDTRLVGDPRAMLLTPIRPRLSQHASSAAVPQRPASAPPGPSKHQATPPEPPRYQARVESDYSDSDKSRGARAHRSRTASPPQEARIGRGSASKEQFSGPELPRSSSNSKSQSRRTSPSDSRAQGKGTGKTQERLRNVDTNSERSTASSTHEDYARGRSRDRAPSERARPRDRRGHESARKASSSTASQRSPHDRRREYPSTRSTEGVQQRGSSGGDDGRTWFEPDPTRTLEPQNMHQGGYRPCSYHSSEYYRRERSRVSSNRSPIERATSSHASFDRSPLASRSQTFGLHTASADDMFHNHDVRTANFKNGFPIEHPRWSTYTDASGSHHRKSTRTSRVAPSRVATSVTADKRRPLIALNIRFSKTENIDNNRQAFRSVGRQLARAADFLFGKVPGGTGPIIGNRVDAGFHY